MILKLPVLYTEDRGIFLFKNYKLNRNILEFDGVKSTADNELSKKLDQNRKIEIIGRNKIRVGNEELDGVGVFLFS